MLHSATTRTKNLSIGKADQEMQPFEARGFELLYSSVSSFPIFRVSR